MVYRNKLHVGNKITSYSFFYKGLLVIKYKGKGLERYVTKDAPWASNEFIEEQLEELLVNW
jgi:hypothetical protein